MRAYQTNMVSRRAHTAIYETINAKMTMKETTDQLNNLDAESRRPPVMWQVVEVKDGDSTEVKTIKFPELNEADGTNINNQQTS